MNTNHRMTESQEVTDLRHKPVNKEGVTNWTNVNMKKLKQALLEKFPMDNPRINNYKSYGRELPGIFRAIGATEVTN